LVDVVVVVVVVVRGGVDDETVRAGAADVVTVRAGGVDAARNVVVLTGPSGANLPASF
jgi:hypothetical protein